MSIKSFFLLVFVFQIGSLQGQTITGKVVDASTGEPLAYVYIELVGRPLRTNSDETGNFKLEINGLPDDATIRFSTIGYPAHTFSIKELAGNDEIKVKLESVTVPLSEVVITPKKTRKAGMTKCAAGPTYGFEIGHLGKEYETGLKIELGELPAFVKSLHVRVHKNSVDSTLLRLHVRNIINGLPGKELLSQNIIIPISKKSGWADIDLSKYQLSLQGAIILSLELVDVKGKNKSTGKRKPANEVIQFNTAKSPTGAYIKQGSEKQWIRTSDRTPSFYLTVI